jgi:hypothetical protein
MNETGETGGETGVAGLSVAVLVSERLGVGYRYDLEPYLGKVVMFICMYVWVRLSVTSS